MNNPLRLLTPLGITTPTVITHRANCSLSLGSYRTGVSINLSLRLLTLRRNWIETDHYASCGARVTELEPAPRSNRSRNPRGRIASYVYGQKSSAVVINAACRSTVPLALLGKVSLYENLFGNRGPSEGGGCAPFRVLKTSEPNPISCG